MGTEREYSLEKKQVKTCPGYSIRKITLNVSHICFIFEK